MRVVTVADPQQLERLGKRVLPNGQTVIDAPDGNYDVQQGALEGTNALAGHEPPSR